MYYSNHNLLIDFIKINFLIPKLYSISVSNNINNIEKYVKYHNKLAKNINKKYRKDLYKYIDIDELYNFKYSISNRKIPLNINTKNCYFLNEIYKKDIIKAYKYTSGIDSIIYHKINKVTDTILFLIYKNNGMERNSVGRCKRLEYCINIWDAIHKLDYNLYYKLNLFLKKNSQIDYIRCILSSDNNLDMETIYLNIMNNINMYCKFNINILFYRKNNIYYYNDPLIFNNLEEDINLESNEIIFVDNKNSIGMCRNKISKVCKIINKEVDCNNTSLKLKFKNLVGTKVYKILLNDIHLLYYYDINSDIYIYLDNSNIKKFYSNKLVIDNNIVISSKIFIHNFKIYNTTNELEKICIYNNIYELTKDYFKNINITHNDDLYTSIEKIKKNNNIELFKIMNKLINKTVKYHMQIISENKPIDLNKYDILFDFLTHIYKNSQSN
ncbi:hypothetical protein AMV173 [Betaentomopoxvirus amoorei]|uniref:AMV173 n=1 Tax=Amsacta moorei entomopoxvirus TaxID=28321 RepID=Q9EMM6_AMEPV|nr:hypothetical protein AMV173 [Amsacta moorei entomopoxvirus]AAG02879.1 AMV173 [Amsacta moorei entomopoxvirus]